MTHHRYIYVDKDALEAATNPAWLAETEKELDEQIHQMFGGAEEKMEAGKCLSKETEKRLDGELKQIFGKWRERMEAEKKLELVPLAISFGWQAKDVAKMAERLSVNLRLLGGPDLVTHNDIAEVQADIVMLEFELREFSKIVTRLGKALMEE